MEPHYTSSVIASTAAQLVRMVFWRNPEISLSSSAVELTGGEYSTIEELIVAWKKAYLAKKQLPVSWNWQFFGPITPFCEAVLSCLAAVPYGTTLSYAELAEQAGYSGANRAVGSVMAKNRIALVVPCHRIVKSGTGSVSSRIGQYALGTPIKHDLLRHEGAFQYCT